MFVNFFCFFFTMVFSLIGVAFVTLLERKVLGYVQLRKGPNKSGLMGLFQPFSDAIKLFTKEFFMPLKSNVGVYWVSPFVSFVVSVLIWVSVPYYFLVISWSFSVLFIFCVMSFSVYGVMMNGWSSNSVYSVLGCLRVVAQSISYEVSFFLLILCVMYFVNSMNLMNLMFLQSSFWFLWLLIPVFFMVLVSFLAELNRTPFDFSEGESELVSGFNVEYGGTGFAFIFLSEYLSIIFASFILTVVFLGGCSHSLYFFIKTVMVMNFIIVIRGALPRYRYDKLMSMCWKSYLTVSLMLLTFYLSICF